MAITYTWTIPTVENTIATWWYQYDTLALQCG